MKKGLKKLTLSRETLCSLTDLRHVAGEVASERTVCATGCATYCFACERTISLCADPGCQVTVPG